MSDRNSFLFERAQRHIPGGVNSPVRAFRSVGGAPRFFAKGCGARVTDVEGREYLDYVGSWGPLILGHAHPDVVAAVQAAAALGLSFGAPTEREVDLADLLCQLVPSMDMVRLVSSGTEATMSAIRLARGFTGRDLLISGASKDVYRVLKNSGMVDVIGRKNVFLNSPKNPNLSTRNALKRAQEILGTTEADIRIFYDPNRPS